MIMSKKLGLTFVAAALMTLYGCGKEEPPPPPPVQAPPPPMVVKIGSVAPLTGGIDAIMTVSHEVEAEQIARLNTWRNARDARAVDAALKELRAAATEGRNVMPASIDCAKAGVTTGEWGAVFREVFGEVESVEPPI